MMACVYAACAVHVTVFSTGSKFCPSSNFMALHTLTLATCSFVLLSVYMEREEENPYRSSWQSGFFFLDFSLSPQSLHATNCSFAQRYTQVGTQPFLCTD